MPCACSLPPQPLQPLPPLLATVAVAVAAAAAAAAAAALAGVRRPSPPMSSSPSDPRGLEQAFGQALAAVQLQAQREMAERMISTCFERCVAAPDARLTDKQRRCLDMCAGSFMEGYQLAVRAGGTRGKGVGEWRGPACAVASCGGGARRVGCRWRAWCGHLAPPLPRRQAACCGYHECLREQRVVLGAVLRCMRLAPIPTHPAAD